MSKIQDPGLATVGKKMNFFLFLLRWSSLLHVGVWWGLLSSVTCSQLLLDCTVSLTRSPWHPYGACKGTWMRSHFLLLLLCLVAHSSLQWLSGWNSSSDTRGLLSSSVVCPCQHHFLWAFCCRPSQILAHSRPFHHNSQSCRSGQGQFLSFCLPGWAGQFPSASLHRMLLWALRLPYCPQIVAHHYSNIPLILCFGERFPIHMVAKLWIVQTNVHDLAFFHVEGHAPYFCPSTHPVQTCLQFLRILRFLNCLLSPLPVSRLEKPGTS